MSKSKETSTASSDCKCKRIGDFDGVRHHFLCDEASDADRAAWLQSRPTPEDRINAHAQQLRYALRSLQRIAQGEPDAAAFAAMSIKHIVGIEVGREMLEATPAPSNERKESVLPKVAPFRDGIVLLHGTRVEIIVNGKEKVGSVSNKYTETNRANGDPIEVQIGPFEPRNPRANKVAVYEAEIRRIVEASGWAADYLKSVDETIAYLNTLSLSEALCWAAGNVKEGAPGQSPISFYLRHRQEGKQVPATVD